MAKKTLAESYRAIIEFISAVAVVLGLVFVGFNIQKSTAVAASEALFALNNSMNRALREIAQDPAAAKVFMKAANDLDSLSNEERFRYDLWARTFLNLNESAWLFHQKGVIGDEEYAGWKDGICLTLKRPGFSEFMESRLDTYMEGFVEDVDNHCSN